MKTSFENEFDWRKYFIVSENVIRQKESSEIEFKETFHSPKHKDKKLQKWIASFANSNGGLIIYGVRNNGELAGLKDDRFKNFDTKDLSQELIEYFAPEIKFEIFSKEVEGFELGFLYIYKSDERPVVAIKTANNNIQESDIFYRYPGQSKTIAYGDLRNLIEEKSKVLNDKWMKLINNIATIGVENVGLLNIENGELIGSSSKLLIPEELLAKIKFINEGHFVENDGAPALKLIGEVLPLDSTKIIQLVEKRYQIITHFELYQSFFKRDLDKESSKDFFRKVLYENTVYYPIYYYLSVCEYTENELQSILKKDKGQKVSDLQKRLRDEKSNSKKFISGNIQTETNAANHISKFLIKLKASEELNIKDIDPSDLRYLIQAITHLDKSTIDIQYILLVLKQLYDYHFTKSSTTKSFIRRAICHVDLTIYGEKFYIT
ncbi:helix-turn-helix domain-containing protein [Flavobacterium pectinovorum]|uniref:ATP-binding protein n=1 Tax=Flavobacterium pectinovorum TaxID=29533 RepID=A0A502E0J3_9FLAO|nr:ATP-binding protein [Flavobacterium pectinovorum]TPG31308.1 ATP-binding protein [Flavobacterium pectinovorum]